jgi:uncharacterized SAM-binding protein YcdF (DUF218 family)
MMWWWRWSWCAHREVRKRWVSRALLSMLGLCVAVPLIGSGNFMLSLELRSSRNPEQALISAAQPVRPHLLNSHHESVANR